MKNILLISYCEKDFLSEDFFCLFLEASKISSLTGSKISALLLSINSQIPPEAKNLGLEKAYFLQDKRITDNNFSAGICATVIEKYSPDLVLLKAGEIEKALSARMAAKMNCGLISDAIEIVMKNELTAIKPALGGNIKVEIFSKSKIKIITFKTYKTSKPKFFQTESPIEILTPNNDLTVLTELIKEEYLENSDKKLEDSPIVIGVGRCVKKEDIPLIKELATILGASIGYTRPAVHEGIGSKDAQIGVSGKTIYPRIYINFAVSGKSYHMNGIKGNPLIISINKDENADIKNFSDYFVKADYKSALIELIQELKKQ